MTPEALHPIRSHRSLGGRINSALVLLAATTAGLRWMRLKIEAVGGLIWAAFAYQRAFDRAAARVKSDLFDSPVLWADISGNALDEAWESSEQAGGVRLPIGVTALVIAFVLCAVAAQILI